MGGGNKRHVIPPGLAMPEVRGTTESHGGAYPHPWSTYQYADQCPHNTRHYLTADGRVETDRLTLIAKHGGIRV